ncbi:TRAP-type C4-dicarboxylate transport system, substrate-binding protein [Thiothrix eikelboomii]|uniref:TRAP-type C4-dicarboxylate transport system, substrate-binding protein n=1 Tax=Thiothrix eikelboomii TaxID=92487 RepID=A0A1T4W4B2_9GAMM|nr:TRAP transporter substrate-binding protein [Thiothrix eikelboomii]SKA71875.1 TRAP-type C4-dicarboxylate transport system, substrate-binding protein [Thiothrix eikelboomii]
MKPTCLKLSLFALAMSSSLFANTLYADTLKMSSWVPTTHFVHTQILEPWSKAVEKVTEGRVKVEILPKALGTPPQHWELARKGVADITWGNFTYEPDRFKSIWFAELPFAGSDAKAQSVALWKSYNQHLQADPAYAGIKLLSVGMFGAGIFNHGSKPLANLADLAGQKIRMGGPIQQAIIEGLGAVPVSAPATKAYEMLESKVLDGSLHTIESVVNFRLTEKLPYHTIIDKGLYGATFFLTMNEKKWKALSDADRAAIEGISGEAFASQWGEVFNQQNSSAEKTLRDAGHTFSTPDPELLSKIAEIRTKMLADWETAAKTAGIADPKALLNDFETDYQALAGK